MKTHESTPTKKTPRIQRSESMIQRQLQGLREFGFEHVIRMMCRFLPERLFGYNHALLFIAINLAPEIPHANDIKVRVANASDAGAAQHLEISPELFRFRVNRGDTGALAVRNGRPISMNWATTAKIFSPLTGSILDPGPNGVYFYNLFTPDEERGKGLARLIYKFQADLHKSRGRDVVYAGVETFNTVSVILHEKFGFTRCGETFRITFLGATCCWYKSWPYPTKKLQLFFKWPTDIDWA